MIPQSNQLIVQAAWAATRGALEGVPKGPGLCLAFVRVVVEAALGMRDRELYARYLVAGTTHRPGEERVRLAAARLSPWATDFEASVKQLGWAVPLAERLPGDLVFNHQAAKPFGHVGVLLDANTVIETIDHDYRTRSVLLPSNRGLPTLGSCSSTCMSRDLSDEREVARD